MIAAGRGVFEFTGYSESDLIGRPVIDALTLNGWTDGKNPVELSLEWGVAGWLEQLELQTKSGSRKPVKADFFPAYDSDGGLLVALTPR